MLFVKNDTVEVGGFVVGVVEVTMQTNVTLLVNFDGLTEDVIDAEVPAFVILAVRPVGCASA
jgi:hypothetical protein